MTNDDSSHNLEGKSTAILILTAPSEDFSKHEEQPFPTTAIDDDKTKEKLVPDNISEITQRLKQGDSSNETEIATPTALVRNERGNGMTVQPVGAFAVGRRKSAGPIEEEETEATGDDADNVRDESRMTVRAIAISAEELESEIRENILSKAVKAEAVDVEAQSEEAALQGAEKEDLARTQISEVKRRRRLWMILFIAILALIIVSVTLGVVLSKNQRNEKNKPPRNRPPPSKNQTHPPENQLPPTKNQPPPPPDISDNSYPAPFPSPDGNNNDSTQNQILNDRNENYNSSQNRPPPPPANSTQGGQRPRYPSLRGSSRPPSRQ